MRRVSGDSSHRARSLRSRRELFARARSYARTLTGFVACVVLIGLGWVLDRPFLLAYFGTQRPSIRVHRGATRMFGWACCRRLPSREEWAMIILVVFAVVLLILFAVDLAFGRPDIYPLALAAIIGVYLFCAHEFLKARNADRQQLADLTAENIQLFTESKNRDHLMQRLTLYLAVIMEAHSGPAGSLCPACGRPNKCPTYRWASGQHQAGDPWAA